MKNLVLGSISIFLMYSCSQKEHSHNYSSVNIKIVYEDSVSIRAIEFLDNNTVAFAGSNGVFGTVDVHTQTVRSNVQQYDSITPEFRAVGHTSSDFFMLSVASPALLYKTGSGGKMELVYKEEGASVFYDALKFWNDKEGVAIGDGENGCLAILLTRDGGNSWSKLPCNQLPKLEGNVGAYAASNTNIEIKGDTAWIMTAKEQILMTEDRGKNWSIVETPLSLKEEYQGIYSIDFYDDQIGFGIGGDFSKPQLNVSNKIRTTDGGKSWSVVADGKLPGYKSCVQFIPNTAAEDLVAVGYSGISYSKNGGLDWQSLSDEGFYTVRFLNDSVAYAAGRNRIARLLFKR